MGVRLSMTRRIAFSSGLRFWLPQLGETENRARFGPLASPFNHGHNYLLEVNVSGEIHPTTGMILNIKIIDDLLQETVVARFDRKSINDQIPEFVARPPTLENLLLYFWGQFEQPIFPHVVQLESLLLTSTPLLHVKLERSQPAGIMTLTRQYEFAASHRLTAPGLSAEENLQLFGKCTNPAGHGHNYLLEVTVTGAPDEKTGMLVDLVEMDRIVNERVVDRYDHKHLNCDVPELQDSNPTSEIVAKAIFGELVGRLPAKLMKIRLHETARSSFEVTEADR
jgi:6-pyruvoyltetrahydropterin/6-carboxytetrahydropterin synthase